MIGDATGSCQGQRTNLRRGSCRNLPRLQSAIVSTASASAITGALGSPFALVAAIALIVGWAVTGPLFGFSETWQLIINTGTTIVTFLMVFVIQASQNRDSKAIHLKLDEVIRAVKGARNELIGEEASSEARSTSTNRSS